MRNDLQTPSGRDPIMRSPGSRRKLIAVITAALLLGVSACGSGSDTASTASTDGDGATPVTEANGDSTAETPSGDSAKITMLNYPGWMGASEVANFEAANPSIEVVEADLPEGGSGAIVTSVRQNPEGQDFALLGLTTAETVANADVVAQITIENVPNLANMPQEFRDAFEWGIPVEQGKVGIIYRKDLVSNPPTSWKEFFEMLPEYSGQVTLPNYDIDVFAIACLALGYDINTGDPDELQAAADLIIEAKPHLKAFLDSGLIDNLSDGSSVMAVGYDYETAAVFGENEDIVWLAPSEGVPAYLDGWVAFNTSENLDAVYEFMNFHLAPENYADFINTTGASYLMPDIESLLDPSIVENPALSLQPDVKIHYERFTGGETNQLRNELWEKIQAS